MTDPNTPRDASEPGLKPDGSRRYVLLKLAEERTGNIRDAKMSESSIGTWVYDEDHEAALAAERILFGDGGTR